MNHQHINHPSEPEEGCLTNDSDSETQAPQNLIDDEEDDDIICLSPDLQSPPALPQTATTFTQSTVPVFPQSGPAFSQSAFSRGRVPPPPPLSSRENYCEKCNRDLQNQVAYETHITEDHEICDECAWNGPSHLLTNHKLSHIKDHLGKVVEDPVADNQAWLAARRRYRQAKRGSSEIESNLPLSELEKYLRQTCLAKRSKRRLERGGVVPQKYQYSAFFEAKRGEALSCGYNNKRDNMEICDQFLKHRSCKYGDSCHHSHDTQKYHRWRSHQVKSGAAVKRSAINSAALIYKLYEDQVVEYENVLMACFRSLVENNFWS